MSDVLIRDVPDDVLRALEASAARLGISRSEYLRRRLAQVASSGASTVSVEDLLRTGDTFAALSDPEVMIEAWK